MAQKQSADPYAQKTKKLASGVQRLRGWVGTDPSKASELVDALVELTAHRLLGNAYAEAAADAQDAVVSAAKLLASHGPIGPYTPMPDAARYFTCAVHLGTIQAGVGLPDAAGRTMQAALDWKDQLPKAGIDTLLHPRTAVWALAAVAHGALAEGDLARANAYADAALVRLIESGLDEDGEGVLLAVGIERLISDCRWAAGLADDALVYARRALARYEELSLPRLVEPARLSPALLERLAEPAFGLYRDVADRLVASGEVATGLQTRRSAIDLLGRVAGRRGDAAAAQLALAWADLAFDLLGEDRQAEAEDAARVAAKVAEGPPAPLGEVTQLLVMPTLASVLSRQGRGEEAMAALEPVLLAVVARDVAAAPDLLAMAALVQSQRAMGADDEAVSTQRALDEAAQPLLSAVNWAALGSVELDTLLRDRARGVVTRSANPAPAWQPLDEATAFTATTASLAAQRRHLVKAPSSVGAERLAAAAQADAQRAEAERREAERQAAAQAEAERRQAERAAAERQAAEAAEAERLAAEAAEAERLAAEAAEAERLAAEQEAARLETKRLREERLEAYRREAERAEAERLEAERLEEERREAERRAADPAEAERLELERLAAELAELERLEAARLAAEEAEVERQAAEQAEAERLEVERLAAVEAARVEAERLAVEAAEAARVEAEAARLAVEQAEVERLAAEQAEAERQAAEQAELERREAARLAAERAEVERLEVERLAAVEAARVEAERLAVELAEADRVEAEAARLAAERAEVERGQASGSDLDELAAAQQDFNEARDAGERRRIRETSERVADLLRPLAEADLGQYGPRLVEALEAQAKARWQTGDLWGSRGPAKEAKALAKLLAGG